MAMIAAAVAARHRAARERERSRSARRKVMLSRSTSKNRTPLPRMIMVRPVHGPERADPDVLATMFVYAHFNHLSNKAIGNVGNLPDALVREVFSFLHRNSVKETAQAVYKSAAAGDASEVERLIIEGCTLTESYHGLSPLTVAASKGHSACVAVLVKYGAEPARWACGSTALHEAAYSGQYETVQLLLKMGSNVRALNSRGMDALDVSQARMCQLNNGPSSVANLFTLKQIRKVIRVLKTHRSRRKRGGAACAVQ